MATRISTAVRNAMADAAVDLLDAGVGAGYVEIYTGTQPASANDAAVGTLLGTLTCSDPAFGNSVAGVATASAITGDTSADATGTAGWFRCFDSAAATKWDGSVTATGGGGDMQLDSISIVAGGTIDITSWTVTVPAG